MANFLDNLKSTYFNLLKPAQQTLGTMVRQAQPVVNNVAQIYQQSKQGYNQANQNRTNLILKGGALLTSTPQQTFNTSPLGRVIQGQPIQAFKSVIPTFNQKSPIMDSARYFANTRGTQRDPKQMLAALQPIQQGVIGSINPVSPNAKFAQGLRESGNVLEQVSANKFKFKGTPLNPVNKTPLPNFVESTTNPRKLIRSAEELLNKVKTTLKDERGYINLGAKVGEKKPGIKVKSGSQSSITQPNVANPPLSDIKQQADNLGIKLNIIDRKPTKAEMVAGKYRNGEIAIYTKKLDGTPKTPEQIMSTFNHEVGHHIDYQRRGIVADPMGDSIRGFDGKLRPATDSDIYVRDMTRHGAELKAIRAELPRTDGAANTQKEIFADAYRLYKENPTRLKEIAPNVSSDLEKYLASKSSPSNPPLNDVGKDTLLQKILKEKIPFGKKAGKELQYDFKGVDKNIYVHHYTFPENVKGIMKEGFKAHPDLGYGSSFALDQLPPQRMLNRGGALIKLKKGYRVFDKLDNKETMLFDPKDILEVKPSKSFIESQNYAQSTPPLSDIKVGKSTEVLPQPIKVKQTPQNLVKPVQVNGGVAPSIPKTQVSALARTVQKAQPKLQQAGSSFDDIVNRSTTDVKTKVGIHDLVRTPDRVLEKIGLKPQADKLRAGYDKYVKELPSEIEKITQWSKQVSPESNQRIFQFLDGQPVPLNPQEAKVAGEVKQYLAQWADKLGLPQDRRVSSYITHIFEKDFIGKEFPDEIANLIRDKVPGSVYDPFVEQRLGKAGYIEDTWRALDAYVKRATRKFNLDPALSEFKAIAPKLEHSQYEYVRKYLDRVNLRPTDSEIMIDNTLKQVFGYKFGARPFTALARGTRQMVYRATLGLNPGSALKNLTQGANTYAKLGEKYTVIGYTKAMKALATGSDELEQAGVLKQDFIQDRSLNATRKFWEKLDKGLFVFFETAEKINRGAAYFGAKAKAINKGMDEAQAIDYAKKIVRDTQFTFGSIDTPPVLSSDVMKTALQFGSFTIKQAEFLAEMAKNKDVAGLLRWGGASMLMVGTIGKLIGMEPKDLIPSLRIGIPPTLQLPYEAGKALLGTKDEYGNERDLADKLKDVGEAGLLFVPGGIQAKKTIQGLDAVRKGYSESKSGRVQYVVPQDKITAVRAGLFGKNNLPQAQEYFDTKASVLGENQSTLVKQSDNKQDVYNQIIAGRKENAVEDLIKKNLESGKTPQGEKATYTIDGEETKGYTANDKFIYLNPNGDVTTKSIASIKKAEVSEKNAIRDSQYTLDAQRALRANDYSAWMKASDTQLQSLKDFQKTLNPKTDQAKINTLQNKIEDLQVNIDKYKGYGGFKKGKKGKKIKVKPLKFPKSKKISVKAIKAKKIKVYNLKKVRKLKTKVKKIDIKS